MGTGGKISWGVGLPIETDDFHVAPYSRITAG